MFYPWGICHIVKVMNTAYCMHRHEGIKITKLWQVSWERKGKLRILPYDVYLNLTAYQ